MSYTKDWRAYPPAFTSLVEAAALKEVRIPCKDHADAKRLEGRLHAFFGVLHRGAARPSPDEGLRELDNLSRQVKVKAIGNDLVAMPRDMEADNVNILAALGQTPTDAKPEDVPMSAEMVKMFAKGLQSPAK
jgi:hypothetical protein